MLSGKIIKWIFKGKSIVINRKSVPTKSKNILGVFCVARGVLIQWVLGIKFFWNWLKMLKLDDNKYL